MAIVPLISGSLIGFAKLTELRALKAGMRKLAGNNDAYYRILAEHGYRHANEIDSGPKCAAIEQALTFERNSLAWETPPPAPKERKRKKEAIPISRIFDIPAQFEQMRYHLHCLTGSNSFYEGVLAAHGVTDLNNVDRKTVIAMIRKLCIERNRIQIERDPEQAARLAELEAAHPDIDGLQDGTKEAAQYVGRRKIAELEAREAARQAEAAAALLEAM